MFWWYRCGLSGTSVLQSCLCIQCYRWSQVELTTLIRAQKSRRSGRYGHKRVCKTADIQNDGLSLGDVPDRFAELILVDVALISAEENVYRFLERARFECIATVFCFGAGIPVSCTALLLEGGMLIST